MRKKDFEAIAGALKSTRDSLALYLDPATALAANDKLDSLAVSIADVCQRQSARFNRLRFLHGCGVSEKNLQKGLDVVMRLC